MRIRSNWNSYIFTSIGNVKDTISLKNNFKFSKKVSITWLTNRYLLKKNESRCLHKGLYRNIHSSLVLIATNWKQPQCPSTIESVVIGKQILGCIHTIRLREVKYREACMLQSKEWQSQTWLSDWTELICVCIYIYIYTHIYVCIYNETPSITIKKEYTIDTHNNMDKLQNNSAEWRKRVYIVRFQS